MAKKITGYIKLQIPAGKANPSPPVGPALGQRGLNIMQFVKEFNAATQEMEPGHADAGGDHRLFRPLLLLRHQDPAQHLLPAEGGEARQGQPRRRARAATIGRVTRSQLREIAETKMKDMNANDVEAAVRMLAGSARSMGLSVVEG